MTGDATPISDEAVAAFEAVYWHEDTAKSREWPIREALAAARPLLVSAEAERPVCVRCGGRDDLMDRAMMPGSTYCRWCRESAALVEGLHAELANEVELRKSYQREVAALRAAGGQEKPVCPLTEAGIEHRPHHYLTPVPWDCPGLPAAPVGGQAEPSGDKAMQLLDEVERIVKFEAGPNDVYMRADVLSVIRQVRAAALGVQQ